MKLSVQKMGVVLSLLFCLLLNPNLSYADIGAIDELTGTVVDENNEPLIGVNVLVKGTANGTSTDFDGNFALKDVASDAVLLVSYIGYLSQEVPVNGRASIQIQLEVNSATLDEVVVTALGISREKKSLGYAVEEIDGGSLNEVIQENVLNALSGKAPGVTINSSGGNAGSSVSMIIRGATSLSGDNQPLFVIDGVPVQNSFAGNTSEVGSRNIVDYGNAISDLNASDIENVSILKGAGASALYGSRAGNGVVLITTKTGQKNQKMKVSLNSSVVFDRPYEYLKYHSLFATGVTPFTEEQWGQLTGGPLVIEEGSAARLGPQLDIGQSAIQFNSPLDADGNPVPSLLKSYPNNVENFLQTGITNTNNIAISGGSATSSFRASYTNMNNEGIIPGSDLYRNSLNLSANYDINKRLSFNTNINVGRTHSNNVPSGNRGTNPLQWAYAVSPHIDITTLQDYWAVEDIQQYQVPDHNNPYFLAYEVDNSFNRDRVYGNIGLDYKLTDDLTATFTYALDRLSEERESIIPYSYGRNQQGAYGISKIARSESNASLLLTYRKYVSDFSFSASAGGNLMYQKASSSSQEGSSLTLPGLYNVSNILPSNLEYRSSWSQKAINSVYGLASIGYKDMVYVDLSARNDWSSTLPEANRSYFYPSATVSALLNNIFNMGNNVDMVKLRAGWAQVGNDTGPYRLLATLGNAGAWGDVSRLSTSGTLLTPDLKPEIVTSLEFGGDLILFQDKIRFSTTYYNSDNENQILPLSLPQSSGYSTKLINAGLVSSRGLELSIGSTLISTKDIGFDVDLNYSFNRTRIEELADGIDFYNFWTDAKGGAYTWVGDDIGNIYDRKLVTVEDESSPYYGWPILDDGGSWNSKSGVNDLVKIGNYNPDFIIGLQSSFRYKNFTLSASLDWRQGGQFVSQTYRYSESDFATQRQLDEIINPNDVNGNIADYLKANADELIVNQTARVGGPTPELGGYEFFYEDLGLTLGSGVFNPGVIPEYDADGNFLGYFENLGGEGTKMIPLADNYPWDFTKAAMFDASFVKLREISLTYQFPKAWMSNVKMDNLALSVYSRNIILWTKADVGIDPERAFQPEGNGSFKQGIERYNVTPFVLPIGIKLSANF
ncbi:SusC/RagA family TonB-linked outer membrane protein [Membranihabitans marinus]|uniref:SusC/RagA family TonB-linked outer membrane protein n=1 Tax=Membranihabitans marinus TaxID=1227546 RepID=UPI001EFFAAAF|nr:SusC/RagA family TonB-linked outer membrane protein [Membranihabitans marinus]